MNNPQKNKVTATIGQDKKYSCYEVRLRWFSQEKNKRAGTSYDLRDKNGNKIPYKTGTKTEQNKYNVFALAEEIRAKKEQELFPNGNMLVVDFAKEWLKEQKKRVERKEISICTYQIREEKLNTHFIPYFKMKNFMLEQVKPKDIVDFFDYLFNKGLSNISQYVSITNQIFQNAAFKELIPANPVSNVPRDKKVTKSKVNKSKVKTDFLREDEIPKVLEMFKGTYIYPMLHVAMYCGLRPSEFLGLRWQDVDLENGKIHVCFSAKKTKGGKMDYSDNLKTVTSNRYVPLLKETTEILKEVKKEQEKNRKLYGNSYYKCEHDFVFLKKNGEPHKEDAILRFFQKRLERNGFRKLRLYDIRHTCASYWRSQGKDAKFCATLLGHKNTNITQDTYTHVPYSELENTFKNAVC